ncbi:hypothetical protein G9A89_007720 [Geosiphon pyriformis]|nr:hypothetical protein G9A89_007720 [Geosiphon pyriformis]
MSPESSEQVIEVTFLSNRNFIKALEMYKTDSGFYVIDVLPLHQASKRPFHLEKRMESKKSATYPSQKLLLQTPNEAQAKREAILEARRLKLSRQFLHVKDVLSKKHEHALHDSSAKRSQIQRTLQSAEQKRNTILQHLVEQCAQQVARCKEVARQQQLKNQEAIDRRRADMERRQKATAARRAKLLSVSKSRFLTVIIPPTREQAAIIIQGAWRYKKYYKAVRNYVKFGINLSSTKAFSFRETVDLLKQPTAIQAALKLIQRVKKASPLTSGSNKYKNIARVFLSAYMIVSHTQEILGDIGDYEKALLDSANSMLVEFEQFIGDLMYSVPNKVRYGPLIRFLDCWDVYYKDFHVWKSKDSEELVNNLISHYVGMEKLWITVKVQPDAEIEWRPSLAKQQEEIRRKVRHLRGDEGMARLEFALRNLRESMPHQDSDEPAKSDSVQGIINDKETVVIPLAADSSHESSLSAPLRRGHSPTKNNASKKLRPSGATPARDQINNFKSSSDLSPHSQPRLPKPKAQPPRKNVTQLSSVDSLTQPNQNITDLSSKLTRSHNKGDDFGSLKSSKFSTSKVSLATVVTSDISPINPGSIETSLLQTSSLPTYNNDLRRIIQNFGPIGEFSLTNEQLAHEIIIDPDFELKPPKRTGFVESVQSIATKAFFDCRRAEFEQGNYENSLPLLEKIKQHLIELVPPSSALYTSINEILDIPLIKQQAKAGVYNISNCIAFITKTMLQICAPVRDEQIQSLKDITDLAEIFHQLLGILDLMRLDLSNYRVKALRPYIKEQAVDYERRKFEQSLRANHNSLSLTKAWLKPTIESLLRIAAERNPENIHLPQHQHNHGIKFDQAYNEALVSYIFQPSIIDKSNCPEPFVLDLARLFNFQNEGQTITIVAALLMLTKNVVIGSDAMKSKSVFAESITSNSDDNLNSLKKTLLVLLTDGDTKLENLTAEILAHLPPTLSAQNQSLIKSMVSKTLSQSDKVFSLLSRRIQTIVKQHLQTGQFPKQETLAQYGVLPVSKELEQLSTKICILGRYNREVYAQWYDLVIWEILGELRKNQV